MPPWLDGGRSDDAHGDDQQRVSGAARQEAPATQRVALVTGSSRGIGAALARRLGADGYRVAVHYSSSEAAANDVVGSLRDAGVDCEAFGADVADPEACQSLVKAVTERFGGLDVLVNNAGITRDTLALRMKDDDWRTVIDTNLSSAFYLARAALRGMLKSGTGRIINITSVVALMGNAGQANYIASKAGLIGLTKALASEYAGKGVTVNAVAPGFIDSDMTSSLTPELRQRYLDRIPAGRFGTADDVAAVVAFLASVEAGYVNGQTVPVDGGMVMP
jgi:3-oxoacyl-[acyl-carrier protein] reductase